MTDQEQKTVIGYFDNEKGDVTLTHYDTPIAICQNQESAIRIINSFNSQSLRISVLEKMNESLRYELAEKEKEIKSLEQYLEQSVIFKKNANEELISLRNSLMQRDHANAWLKEEINQLKNTKP